MFFQYFWSIGKWIKLYGWGLPCLSSLLFYIFSVTVCNKSQINQADSEWYWMHISVLFFPFTTQLNALDHNCQDQCVIQIIFWAWFWCDILIIVKLCSMYVSTKCLKKTIKINIAFSIQVFFNNLKQLS